MLRLSLKRFVADKNFIYSDDFYSIARGNNKNAFIRKRKLPLPLVVLSILSRKGITLKMELRNFIKKTKIRKISKVGYLKQRLKLNPLAIKALNDFHVKNFYHDDENIKTWNDHLIMAIDGSDINLPTTEDTLNAFGNASRKGTKKKAQAGISCLYDCLNHMILDTTINAPNFDERGQAKKHIKRIPEFISKKSIITMDRGYPGIDLLLNLIDNNCLFVIRLDKCTYKKEQKSMKTSDEIIQVVFDQPRINPYRGTELEDRLKKMKSIALRFVKIKLSSGEEEFLLTNLDQNTFTTEQIYELYGLRWGIETAYEELKNKLQLENFSGTKPVIIEQDIYTSVYLLNIMQDIIQDAEQELEGINEKYTYPMAINRNVAFGIIKEELIEMFMIKSNKKRKTKFESIISEIEEELLPIRKDRKFNRTKGNLVSVYSNTHKRSY